MKNAREEKKKLYQQNWFLWLCLIFFPPIGLILLWVCHKEKKKAVKVILTVVFALWFGLLMPSKSGGDTVDRSAVAVETATQTPRPTKMPKPSAAPEPTPTPKPSTAPKPMPTPKPSTAPKPMPTPKPSTIPTPMPTLSPTPTLPASAEVETTSAGEKEAEAPSTAQKGSGSGENFNTYDEPSQQKTTAAYVLNTDSKKFHRPGCSSVKKIAPENYATSSESRSTLISQGYSACKICDP